MPFIYSIPSPLDQALYHVSTPERVYADMKTEPDLLKEGLMKITQTCIDFARACVDEGASGIFYGVGGGGAFWSKMSRKQLVEYALRYDKEVLTALADAPIKMLHICSAEHENPQQNGGLMEDGWFNQYPVNVINWWDASFTSCATAKKIYGPKFCLLSGLDQRSTMRYGTPKQVEEEVKKAIEGAAGDGGFIIGPGCTLFQDTPLENYNAVARAVLKYGVYQK
jgi:uroporphyrinogen decarboxylase